MKQILTILSLTILLFCQCKKDSSTEKSIEGIEYSVTTYGNDKQSESQVKNEEKLTKNQIDSLTKEIDQLFEQQLLAKYFYPNMSRCGGGLYGYFMDTSLLIIDATYQAELGFSSQKMYWHNNNIIKIIYREHFAEWTKYEENYPPNKLEWDPSKMTYTDTIYQITLGNEYQMQKVAGSKVISEKQDSILINRLVDCGFEMKNELGIEKKLE